jgi:phage-related protein
MILTRFKMSHFGESNNLRKLIKSISLEELEALKDQKKVDFTLSNITDNKMEYIHTRPLQLHFCDWIWASCNYTPFMSLFQKWMSIC